MKQLKYTKQEIDFIKRNYPKYGSKYCSKQLHRSTFCIAQKATRLGIVLTKQQIRNIQIKARERENSYYRFNPDVFIHIKKPEAAYILGFLWADGALVYAEKRGAYSISLEICKKDFLDIEKTAFSLGEWRKYERKRGSYKRVTCIKIHVKPLAKYLFNNDFLIKSTGCPRKILSKIPKELRHYWWRGYFDGDGCLFVGEKSSQLAIAGSYKQNWTNVVSLFNRLKIKSYRINRYRNKKSQSSDVRIQNRKDILVFLKYIYQHRRTDNIGLSRKYGKYKILLNKTPKCKTYFDLSAKMWKVSNPIWTQK